MGFEMRAFFVFAQLRRPCCRVLLCAFSGVAACTDPTTATACVWGTTPAIVLSFASGIDAKPVSANTTIVFERLGDDSLVVIRGSTGSAPTAIGSLRGTYELRAITPGFADWLIRDVVVEQEGCEPRTVHLNAFLQPVP